MRGISEVVSITFVFVVVVVVHVSETRPLGHFSLSLCSVPSTSLLTLSPFSHCYHCLPLTFFGTLSSPSTYIYNIESQKRLRFASSSLHLDMNKPSPPPPSSVSLSLLFTCKRRLFSASVFLHAVNIVSCMKELDEHNDDCLAQPGCVAKEGRRDRNERLLSRRFPLLIQLHTTFFILAPSTSSFAGLFCFPIRFYIH